MAFGHAPDGRDTVIDADMLGHFLRDAPLRLVVSQICMLLVVAMWWRFLNHALLFTWLAAGVAIGAALWMVERPYWHHGRPLDTPQAQRRMILALAPIYVAAGMFWAFPPLFSVLQSTVPRPIQAASNLIYIGMSAAPASGIALSPTLTRYYEGALFGTIIAVVLALTWHVPLLAFVSVLIPAVQCVLTVAWSDGVFRRHRRMCVLQRELAGKEREARLAIETHRRLLAAATHDMRQPVAALSIFASHLIEHPELHRELAPKIAQATDTANHLFDSLFEHSALENDAVSVSLRSAELGPLLARLHDQWEPVARARGIALRLHGLPKVVRTDPMRLQRMVSNVLANAIKYSPRGTRILLAGRICAGRPCIQIWDQGVGIHANELRRIFQAFYRVEAQQSRDEPGDRHAPGMGLGLSIVARMAQLLDVRLEVRSVPGRGTRFTLQLPAPQAAAPVPPTARPGETVLAGL
jgi:signal transduction histidine kinase